MIRRPLTPQEQARERTLIAWAQALLVGRKLLPQDPYAEVLRGISRWTCANPCSCPQYRHDPHVHEYDYTNLREHL
jgi:hypothetical protein